MPPGLRETEGWPDTVLRPRAPPAHTRRRPSRIRLSSGPPPACDPARVRQSVSPRPAHPLRTPARRARTRRRFGTEKTFLVFYAYLARHQQETSHGHRAANSLNLKGPKPATPFERLDHTRKACRIGRHRDLDFQYADWRMFFAANLAGRDPAAANCGGENEAPASEAE